MVDTVDEALRHTKPDETHYLGYDSFTKANPRYHHSVYYPHKGEGVETAITPQMNNISFHVSVTI